MAGTTFKLSGGGATPKSATFTTSGDNSWTPPVNMINGIVFVEMLGGGGGGGAAGAISTYGAGGGGGGMYIFIPVKLANLGVAHNVRVAAAAAGGVAGANDGADGNESYLDYSGTVLVRARGGKKGLRGASGYQHGGNGGGVRSWILGDGGIDAGADGEGGPGEEVRAEFPGGFNGAGGGGGGTGAGSYDGGQGGRSLYSWLSWIAGGIGNASYPGGGGGGSSLLGSGGAGGNAATAGTAAAANTGGGGGGAGGGASAHAGGDGGSGLVRLYWLEV